MNNKVYEYDGIIHEIPEKGGAYVEFPWNIREEFQKGRVKVHATFDGIAYDGRWFYLLYNWHIKKHTYKA